VIKVPDNNTTASQSLRVLRCECKQHEYSLVGVAHVVGGTVNYMNIQQWV